MNNTNLIKFILLISCSTYFLKFYTQGSGNTLTFNGTNQSINIGNQVANGCRTIELWFKLDNSVTPALAAPITLVARDFGNGSILGTNEFGLHFNPASWIGGGGRLVFNRRVGSISNRILSNNNNWIAGHWYHVAAVIDPISGMRLYVNGELQAQTNPTTNPIGTQNAAVTDDVFIGQWGFPNVRFFNGVIDEVRFWVDARTEPEIKSFMCQSLNGNEPGLQAYYDFDGAGGITLLDQATGIFPGATQNMTALNRILSGAPIGDTSTYLYSTNFLGQSLSLTNQIGDTLLVDNIFPSGKGLHLYKVNTLPNSLTGLATSTTPNYYGVFMTDTNGPYNIKYSHHAYTCDSCMSIYTRNDNSVLTWTSINTISDSCVKFAVNESTIGQDYRAEYIIDEKKLSLSLGNDTMLCMGDTIWLVLPLGYTNYKWQDNSSGNSLAVTSAGTYYVTVDSNGCSDSDTIIIGSQAPPVINLGNDSIICDNGIVSLSPGTGFLSYLWQDNSTFNTFNATGSGSYHVTVNDGLCTVSDTIQLDYFNTLNFDLGIDTTLCPGEELILSPGNYNSYLWQDYSSNSTFTVNSSGTYHVLVNQNQCERSDTIHVDYLSPPVVDLGPDMDLGCIPDYTISIVDPIFGYNYVWSTGHHGNSVTIDNDGLYIVNMTTSFGECRSSDSIYVNFDCDIFIPNAFTPNQDGLNDVFKVISEEDFINFEFTIFNRWGKEVFVSYNIQDFWDGKHKKTACPSGIYTWKLNYITTDNQSSKRKSLIGHVNLSR